MRKIATVLLCTLIFLLMVGCGGNANGNKQTMSFGGESMAPTITNGVKVTVDTKAYLTSQPQRGDIIAFKDESGVVMVKRVIGLPGEQLEIKDQKVYINGQEIKENYIYKQNSTEPRSNSVLKIPDKNIFVMGDNREHSKDSRDFGPVHFDKVMGKVMK